MTIYKMVEKAMRLVRDNRIEHLEGNKYNAIGDHGTYSVVIRKGKVACSCPGFQGRGHCSHSEALKIMRQRRR